MANRAHVETIPQKIEIWTLTLETLKEEIKKFEAQLHPDAVAIEVAKSTQLIIEEKLKALKEYQEKLDQI